MKEFSIIVMRGDNKDYYNQYADFFDFDSESIFFKKFKEESIEKEIVGVFPKSRTIIYAIKEVKE